MHKWVIFLFFGFSALCFGQSAGSHQILSGKVTDSVSYKQLPYVTVTLVYCKDSTTRYALTDSTGIFHFSNLLPDAYFLKFTMTGYRSARSGDFTLSDSSLNSVQEYLMAPSAIQLAPVVISSTLPVIKFRIDGFTYNAQNDIPAAGETASDLLRKLPAIVVNPEGSPTIRGSSAIKVFINDRPSEAYASSITEALKQVPSETIARIEVITQPSAHYDAEGVDAVILIYSKKSINNGLSGIVNGQASNRNPSLTENLNIRHNRWISVVSAGYSYSYNPNQNDLTRTGTNGPASSLTQRRETARESNWISASINTFYTIDTLSTWNAGYSLRPFWGSESNWLANTLLSNNATHYFTREIDRESTFLSHALNGGYVKKSSDRKTELNILALCTYEDLDGNYILQQVQHPKPVYHEDNKNSLKNLGLSAQADLSKQFSNKSVLDMGIKVAYTDHKSDSYFRVYNSALNEYVPDNARSNSFQFNRVMLAVYSSYLFNVGAWKLRTGVRYEHTLLNLRFSNTSLEVPDYQNLMPSVLVSRSFSDNHQLSFSYSKRLTRPYISYLNPIVNYVDSLNLEFGNPALRPMTAHNTEVAYTYTNKGFLLTSSLFFNQIKNGFENIRSVKAGGIVESTYMNVSSNRTLGGLLSSSLRLSKLTFNTNHTLLFVTLTRQTPARSVSGTVSSHYLNIGYKFLPNFSAELSGTLNAGQVNFQSTVTGTQWYSLLLIRTFNKGKLSASLRLDNFASFSTHTTEIIDSDNFRQTTLNYFPLFLTRVGISYKIGKKTIQEPSTRRLNNES